MGSYRSFYSEGFPSHSMGWVTGSAVVSRFPNVPGYIFRLRATSTNKGSFFFGLGSGSNQQQWEMDSGDDTDWFKIPGDNLNKMFYYNASGASETMAYWSQQ